MARFLSFDPLAGDFPSWTSYHYVHNNSLRYTDPTGMRAEEVDWEPKVDSEGNITYVSEDGDSYRTFVEQYGEDAARSVFESNCEGCFDKDATYSEGEIALSSKEPLKLIIDNKSPEGGYILDMLFGGDGKGTTTDIQDISNQLALISELGKDWSIDDFFMSRDGGNTPSFKTSGSLMVDGHAYSNGFVNFDRALVQSSKKFPASPRRGMTIDGFKRDYHAGKNAPALKFTYFNLK